MNNLSRKEAWVGRVRPFWTAARRFMGSDSLLRGRAFLGRMGFSEPTFWILCCFLICLKLALTADLAVQMVYSPHDDGLYVSRAYHLLLGQGLGPYDARLLVKLPGLSFWVAFLRILGIPYLLALNLLHAGTGLYFIGALRCCRLGKLPLLGVFALHLFNPISLDWQWIRIMREPVDVSLLTMMFGAIVFLCHALRMGKIAVTHMAVFAAAFALTLLLREEAVIFYFLFWASSGVFLWEAWRSGLLASRPKRLHLAALLLFPLVLGVGGKAAARIFVRSHYGLPILHEMSEGEFPRLIAAMRSVVSRRNNRYVMVTQEALGNIRRAVPLLEPVISRLPPPGKDTYSYGRFGVSEEWTSGWMVFWIKDAAHQAGLTPDLTAAQAFFRQAREAIQDACRDGRLVCRDTGQGLLPRFHPRWARPLMREFLGVVSMTFKPPLGAPAPPPVAYDVSVDYGRMYQMATMTHRFDSALHVANEYDHWKTFPPEMYLSLKYWLRYPDIAMARDFGPNNGGHELRELGALMHYERHGRFEGRVWGDKSASSAPREYQNPFLSSSREKIIRFYGRWGTLLLWLGAGAFFWRVAFRPRSLFTPLGLAVFVFIGLSFLRWGALSYVSVYMGGLDPRLFFSSHAVLALLSVSLFAEGLALSGTGLPRPECSEISGAKEVLVS